MPPLIDLTGQTFSRLTVLERVANKNNRAYWKCQCECGNITNVQADCLKSGNTKSCGCIHSGILIERNTKHSMANTPEYDVWTRMVTRCTNKNIPGFKDYGGRGITICSEWRHDFMAFYNHVGKRPSPKHSIDRIKNNIGYLPGNVRWATRYEQNNNKRNNHKITIHGWTMNISQWAKFVGKDCRLISYRLKKGWPPAKAIFYPILPRGRNYP